MVLRQKVKKTITCPSGTGNLTGVGNIIKIGNGGTCNSLGITDSPTFAGNLTVNGDTALSTDSLNAFNVTDVSGSNTVLNVDTQNKVINLSVDGVTADIRTWGGEGSQSGYSIITATDGGLIVAGISNSNSQNSNFVTKYDSASNIIWSKSIEIEGNFTQVSGVAQTVDGGYVVTGYTQSILTNAMSMFATKISNTGSYAWTKTWSSSSQDIGYDIVANPDGGFTIFGISNEPTYNIWETFIARFDSVGNLVWNRTLNINNTQTYPYDLVRLTDGGYVVTGEFNNGVDGDAFIAKLTSSGDNVWTKSWGGSGYDGGEGLVASTDGGFALTGYTDSYGNPSGSAFIAKYDSGGNLSWDTVHSTANYTSGRDITQTIDGGFAITGLINDAVSNLDRSYLAKVASDGSFLWSQTFGGNSYEYGYEYGASITPLPSGGVAITGESTNFGEYENDSDAFIAKYSSTGSVTNCISPLCVSIVPTTTLPGASSVNYTPVVTTPSATLDSPNSVVSNSVGSPGYVSKGPGFNITGSAGFFGKVNFKSTTDNKNAFGVQNSANATVLSVDTLNKRVGVGTKTPAKTFTVSGDSLIQSVQNTSEAFQVQNLAGYDVLKADTANNSITIGNSLTNNTFSFSAQTATTINHQQLGIDSADLNNDGYKDMIIKYYADNPYTFGVAINNGDGTFSNEVSYSTVGGWGLTMEAISSDLNNDGYNDIIINGYDNSAGYKVVIWLNNGDGTFIQGLDAPNIISNIPKIATGDINIDGNQDMIQTYPGFTDVLMGNGDGTFVSAVTYNTGGALNMYSSILGDLNSDTYPDVTIMGSSGTKILINNGDGTFSISGLYIGSGGSPVGSIGDLNNDSHIDIVKPILGGIQILFNNGDATFSNLTNYTDGDISGEVFIIDYDNDSYKDILFNRNGFLVYMRNDGYGYFSQRDISLYSSTEYSFGDIVFEDFDNDGMFDIGVGGGEIFTLKNTSLIKSRPAPPVLTVRNNDSNKDSFRIKDSAGKNLLNIDGEGNLAVGESRQTSLFSPGVDYSLAGLWLNSISIQDLNNDGYLDMVVRDNSGSSVVSVLINNGDGTYAPGVNYSADGTLGSSEPNGITTGDFNNDEYLDLATTNYSNDTLSVFLNNGDGTFSNRVNYATGTSPDGVVTGLFNNDLCSDIIVSNSSSFSLYISNCDGTFGNKIDTLTTGSPGVIKSSDFNNDGYDDIAFGSGTGFGVRLNNKDNTFGRLINYGNVNGNYGLEIADLNSDGSPDAIYVAYGNSGYEVYSSINNSDGTFRQPEMYILGYPAGVSELTVADFNNDSIQDIIMTDAQSLLAIRLGVGNGQFYPATLVSAPSQIADIDAADVNNDGKNDLIIVSQAPGYVSVLSNIGVSKNRLQVYNSTGSKELLNVSSSGSAVFRSAVDSAVAFQIQDKSDASIFTVNTATAGASVAGSFTVSGTTTNLNTTGISTVTIGSTAGASATTIQAGTGNVNLVTNSGSAGVIVRSGTDSSIAFQVQNAIGTSLLTVDTVNNLLFVGNPVADTVGTLLVLDVKNTAGDPTGVEGAMYFNSSIGSFRCFSNGVWRDCTSPLVATNTTIPVSNTVANTTTETDFSSNYTIPADKCQPGKVYRITARGVYSTAPAPGALTIRAKLGSTVVGATASADPTASLTDRGWVTSITVTCISSGATGSVEGQGSTKMYISSTSAEDREMVNTNTITIDTTTTQVVQLSAEWAVADASNSITLRQLVVEEL